MNRCIMTHEPFTVTCLLVIVSDENMKEGWSWVQCMLKIVKVCMNLKASSVEKFSNQSIKL